MVPVWAVACFNRCCKVKVTKFIVVLVVMCMWRACELLICAFVQSKCGLSSVNTCRYYFFFFWYTSNVSWYIHICVCVFLNVGKLFLGNCYHIHSSHVCSVLFCSLVASPYNIYYQLIYVYVDVVVVYSEQYSSWLRKHFVVDTAALYHQQNMFSPDRFKEFNALSSKTV